MNCDAQHALDSTRRGIPTIFRWSAPSGGKLMNNVVDGPVVASIQISAEGEDSEGPGRLRIRRDADEEWSEAIGTPDLSSSMAVIGTDVGWEHVPETTKAWIESGDPAPMLAALRAHAARGLAPPTGWKAAARARRRHLSIQRGKRLQRVLKYLGGGWSRVPRSLALRCENGASITLWGFGLTRPGVRIPRLQGRLRVGKLEVSGTLRTLRALLPRLLA